MTVPLNLVIDCQKQYKTEWKSKLDIVLKEKELANVDAGFGMNTYADDEASYIAQEMVKRGMK